MRRVLLIGSPSDTEIARAELARQAPDLALVLAADEGELARALDVAPDAVVLALGGIGLDFGAVQQIWRGRGFAPPCVVLSRENDDELMRSVMRTGAADYVSAAGIARLGPALARELARGQASAPLVGSDSKALFEAVVDGLPLVLFVKDAIELRLCAINQLAVSVLGAKTREEMIGLLDHQYLPKEQAEAFIADDLEVLASVRAETARDFLSSMRFCSSSAFERLRASRASRSVVMSSVTPTT